MSALGSDRSGNRNAKLSPRQVFLDQHEMLGVAVDFGDRICQPRAIEHETNIQGCSPRHWLDDEWTIVVPESSREAAIHLGEEAAARHIPRCKRGGGQAG